MKYYWDSSHFKEVVGDHLLDQIFERSTPGRQVPDDFGVRLTPDNIESALARDRAAQARYRAAHPGDIDRIKRLLAEAPGDDGKGGTAAARSSF